MDGWHTCCGGDVLSWMCEDVRVWWRDVGFRDGRGGLGCGLIRVQGVCRV